MRTGFIVEGLQRGKLRYDGQRYDVELHARLATDPGPAPGQVDQPSPECAFSARQRNPVIRPPAQGAGCHERGEDAVGVAVEVLGGSVVALGGARVAVAGGDLDHRAG